jgi:hypothetical protein
MLTEQEIQQALHASRVVPLAVPSPHGPLGLEQLAAAVANLQGSPVPPSGEGRIARPISLSVQAWEKLSQLAQATAQSGARSLTPGEVATVIIEQFVATTPPG